VPAPQGDRKGSPLHIEKILITFIRAWEPTAPEVAVHGENGKCPTGRLRTVFVVKKLVSSGLSGLGLIWRKHRFVTC
jgi:hypothetical protein